MKRMADCFFAVAALGLVISAAGAASGNARAAGQAQGKAPAGNVQNGKKLFASVGCNGCHGDDAQGMTGTPTGGPKIGPPAMAYPAFVQQVREPSGRMMAFGSDAVSDAQLADIYAYLQSLGKSGPAAAGATGGSGTSGRTAAGNADNGKRIYSAYGCYECHGLEGQGSLQTGASRIGPPPIALEAFVTYVRQPANQMPPYTAKAVADAELADIYAFLLTRPTPPPAKDIPLLNK